MRGVRPTDSVLDRIVAAKAESIAERKRQAPESDLGLDTRNGGVPLPLAGAITRIAQGADVPNRTPFIVAEIKKASPSRGEFVGVIDPVAIARAYGRAGAVGISVVTEVNYFHGDIRWLRDIRLVLQAEFHQRRPSLLRKDFLIDPYEIAEARAYGADNVLLIVAMLDDSLLTDLMTKAEAESLEALVEIHNEGEAERAMKAGARLFGINNRDLHTFDVDLATTERIRPLLPADAVVIAESGVASRADAERLARAGVQAILVGESLMLAHDIQAKMDELRL